MHDAQFMPSLVQHIFMDASEQYTFSDLLRQFRVREGFSQQELADKLAVHRNTIGAWERGDNLPRTRPTILELAKALRLCSQDIDQLLRACLRESSQEHQAEEAALSNPPQPFWNVFYRRNPFFTGREELLTHLYQVLHANGAVALTQSYALTGLGGIGKTQTAVEYAYRYRDEYHAVLWATADTVETLVTGFVKIARVLNLPQQNEPDQNIVIQVIKRWLEEHEHWLLILDNADDLSVIPNFFPAKGNGHILLTTRAQAIGTLAENMDVGKMEIDEGTLFLLRRTKLLPKGADLDTATVLDHLSAQAIVYALDGLPLALDQAGAYIEETSCGLVDYLERYKLHHMALLKRRGQTASEYPETVATTWAISFEKVEHMSPVAADLLRCCAFLSPDAIPEEILTAGASKLGPGLEELTHNTFALDHAISILLRYSLVRRIADQRLLTIHRLVQAVLKGEMNGERQRQWAERIVQAVGYTFPNVDMVTWPQCLRCLPQALTCADLIREYHFTFLEATQLLAKAGAYLHDHAQYREAEPLYLQVLAIHQPEQGTAHPDTAHSLNNLGNLYWSQGKYSEAELLYQQALAIRGQVLGSTHPDVAQTLNNLGDLYWIQGQSSRAEPYYKQALAIREQVLGQTHPDIAQSFDRLAKLSWERDKRQAEFLYKRALAIREQTLPSDHPDIAQSLKNLGGIYWSQGRYRETEPFYERALAIDEQTVGPEHPETAQSLKSLGTLYVYQGEYIEAEPLLLRALAIRKRVLGSAHLDVAESLHGLGDLYLYQGRYQEAIALYQQAVAIREPILGSAHPDVVVVQGNAILALLRTRQLLEAARLSTCVLKAVGPMKIVHLFIETWKIRKR